MRPLLTSPKRYPVRGVDVSAYQGEIDWEVLATQGIDFAYIKATEGSGSVDERFAENWTNVAGTNLRAGAYHFFSFDSPGSTQAENFIRTVQPREGMLPPVVDVELYGAYKRRLPDAKAVRAELQTLIDALEVEYGQPPVLYARAAPTTCCSQANSPSATSGFATSTSNPASPTAGPGHSGNTAIEAG